MPQGSIMGPFRLFITFPLHTSFQTTINVDDVFLLWFQYIAINSPTSHSLIVANQPQVGLGGSHGQPSVQKYFNHSWTLVSVPIPTFLLQCSQHDSVSVILNIQLKTLEGQYWTYTIVQTLLDNGFSSSISVTIYLFYKWCLTQFQKKETFMLLHIFKLNWPKMFNLWERC